MQEQNYIEINNRVNTIHCFICGREYLYNHVDLEPKDSSFITKSAKWNSTINKSKDPIKKEPNVTICNTSVP